MKTSLRDHPSLRRAGWRSPVGIASRLGIAALAGGFLPLASCGVGSHSPTEPTCDNLSGSYHASFTNSRGGSGTATVSGTSIAGSYSGAATGIGCCNPVSGSFVLER